MVSSEPLVVVVTIETTVEHVILGERLHHFFYVGHALGSFSHGLGRVVGVAARSIPFWEELRGIRDHNVEVFCHSSEKVSSHPKMVADSDTLGRSDLEFPLSWHYLSVGSTDCESGVDTSSVVEVGDDAAVACRGTDRAVVWSLRSRISI